MDIFITGVYFNYSTYERKASFAKKYNFPGISREIIRMKLDKKRDIT